MKALYHVLPGALLGCCTLVEGEPPAPDVEAPAEWTAAKEAEGEIRFEWWKDFGAELARQVEEALGHNRNLRALAERVVMAEAQARIAGADLWPQLSGGLQGQRQKQVFVGFPIPGAAGGVLSKTFTSYGVSLDVSWEVDLWGRLRSRRDAAKADFAAAGLDFAATRLSLVGQVCKAWFALATARQQLELAQRTVDNYRRTVEIVEDRFRVGARPEIDLRLTRSTLLSAEADLELRRQLLDAARRQLELLLGRYPEGSIAAASLPALPAPPPAGLPAEILDRRPDLRARRQALLAAHWRVGEARGALYPRIALTGSTGTVGNELADLLDGDFHVWSIFGNLMQPIFQGGRLRAGVDLAEAARSEVLSRFANAVLGAFGEVEAALAAASYLRAQREAVARLVEETDTARTIAAERYRQGRGTLLELLAAERNSVIADSRLLALRRQELVTRIDLHLALGGGFPPPAPERTEEDAR